MKITVTICAWCNPGVTEAQIKVNGEWQSCKVNHGICDACASAETAKLPQVQAAMSQSIEGLIDSIPAERETSWL